MESLPGLTLLNWRKCWERGPPLTLRIGRPNCVLAREDLISLAVGLALPVVLEREFLGEPVQQ